MQIHRRIVTLVVSIVLIALTAVPALARPVPNSHEHHAWCGTHPDNAVIAIARDAKAQRRLAREHDAFQKAGVPFKMEPVRASRFGGIAILEDNGTLIQPDNRFDLAGQSLQFLRRPRGMSVVRAPIDYIDTVGELLPLTDDSAVRFNFPPEFRFPFQGRTWDHVWVNSDGNLTFGNSSPFTSRDLQGMNTGPPRIAVLFTDLNPEEAADGNGVFLEYIPPARVRVTWRGVPEFGGTRTATMQVTLFLNGRVVTAYGDGMTVREGVVGVTPGGNPADINIYDYTVEVPEPPRPGTVAEEFVANQQISDPAVARAFFDNFRDNYDHVILWLDFPLILGGGAFAYESNIFNTDRGIGLPDIDRTAAYGSNGQLKSFLQMGGLARYPSDPDQLFLGTNSTMAILGQETGHRWLSFALAIDPRTGLPTQDLLGRALSHWSYNMDSEGSVMEGNDWEDEGGGSFRTTEPATVRFSAIDQYFMGLIPANRVPDFFYVDDAQGSPGAGAAPVNNGVITGTRVNMSINDLIAFEGPRVPNAGRAPKIFNMAFVLLHRQGEPPSQASLNKLENFRQRWNTWFLVNTDRNGRVNTVMQPR